MLFKNGLINKALLRRYVRFIKGSDDKDHNYRTLKLLYTFYKQHCDSTITFDNFKEGNLDQRHCVSNCIGVNSNCAGLSSNCINKKAMMEQIQSLEATITELKHKLQRCNG